MSGEEHPTQQIDRPGVEAKMEEQPQDEMRGYEGSSKLPGKVALITGGDSGIGRAVAIAFAKEGADVAISYLNEDEDAERTRELVEAEGRRVVLMPGDIQEESHCNAIVERTVSELGGLDIVVNHAATQTPVDSPEEITTEQWMGTFTTNVHAQFWVTRAALKHLPDGAAIIFTGSINGLRGNASLIDYAATKGAVHIFAQSLAKSLMERRIRVNVVAPGPVWTPLIPATMPVDKVETFGQQTPMGRAAQPDEIAPSYVFFASEILSSYYTGEVLAPIGGETLPG